MLRNLFPELIEDYASGSLDSFFMLHPVPFLFTESLPEGDVPLDELVKTNELKARFFQVYTGPSKIPVLLGLEKDPSCLMADISHTVFLGRGDYNDINLPYATVSKFHAYFQYLSGGWIINDRGSVNGTIVNSNKLERDVDYCIANKDRILLGDLQFTYLEKKGVGDLAQNYICPKKLFK